jgi:hypothetical protein
VRAVPLWSLSEFVVPMLPTNPPPLKMFPLKLILRDDEFASDGGVSPSLNAFRLSIEAI